MIDYEKEFDKRLEKFKKFLDDRKKNNKDKTTGNKTKNKDKSMSENIIDKEKFTPEPKENKKDKKDKAINIIKNKNIEIPKKDKILPDYKMDLNKLQKENELAKKLQEEQKDIQTLFQVVIRIDRAKLEYVRVTDKIHDVIVDSNILVMKDPLNKLVFPTIEMTMLRYEIEMLREMKNNDSQLSLNSSDINKVQNLYKKALIIDIYEMLDSFFKENTYSIKSVSIGKEYRENKFFLYVEIVNPVERSKAVKFRNSKIIIDGNKYKLFGVNISELIDMAVKYNTKTGNPDKNPFSAILMLYLAEVTYREDRF